MAPDTTSNLATETLVYPMDSEPKDTKVVQVADGVIWARVSLPFSLDHINVYLCDEGDSWTLVDTGINGDRSREAWQAIEADVLDGKPIRHVIATHMHPDHLGLAGWLCERYGAKFSITQGEYLYAQKLWLGADGEMPQSELDHLFASGVDPSLESTIREKGYGGFRKGVSKLPDAYHRLQDGSVITFGGRRWQVVIGRGHSPEHACLMSLDDGLFISGDQILPHITSNVSVYSMEPMANPLALWISSLNRLKQVKDDVLVLPSHGRVFKGLHKRIDEIIEDHFAKLTSLHAWCSLEPRSTIETFPSLYRRKITGVDFYLGLGEAIAHLHLLESLGLMTREQDDMVYRFRSTGTLDTQGLIADIDQLPGVILRSLSDFDDALANLSHKYKIP